MMMRAESGTSFPEGVASYADCSDQKCGDHRLDLFLSGEP